jgi:hypothetical protein
MSMATANCSSCGGEINTKSSPSGKCVRCLEVERRQVPLSLPDTPVAPPATEPPAPSPVLAQEAFAEPAVEGAHGEHVEDDQAAVKGEEDPF